MNSIRLLKASLTLAILSSSSAAGALLGTSDAQRIRPYVESRAEAYGMSVAAAGNTAIIGHRGFDNGQMFPGYYYHGTNEGIAEVYEMNNHGVWKLSSSLRGTNVRELDNFGSSVATDGRLAVIGAIGADAGGSASGAAWLFEAQANGNWQEVANLNSSIPISYGGFATSVATSNRRVAVSAPNEDANGAVHIFEEDQSGYWHESALIRPPVPGYQMEFGHSIALHGDTLVVGAHDANRPGSNIIGDGAAFIYQRNSTGNWNLVTTLSPDDRRDAQFGFSVSIWNDTLAVSCASTLTGASNAGTVYVFKEDASGAWNKVARLALGDQSHNDDFGKSIAVRSGTVLVGATGVDYPGYVSRIGAAFVYRENSHGDWEMTAELNSLLDSAYNDNFGYTVALADNAAIVGSPSKHDSTGWSRIGAVYVYNIPEPMSLAIGAGAIALASTIRGRRAMAGPIAK